MHFGAHSTLWKFVLVFGKALVEVGCLGWAQDIFVFRQEQVDFVSNNMHLLIGFCFGQLLIHTRFGC